MKTSSTTFFKLQLFNKPLCEKEKLLHGSWWGLSLSDQLTRLRSKGVTLEKEKNKNRNSTFGTLTRSTKFYQTVNSALVAQVRVLVSKVKSLTVKQFVRVVVGFGLYGVCAPAAEIMYTWLDKNDRVPMDVWYYESYFFLFLVLGPSLDKIFSWIGAYLIFIKNNSPIKLLLISFPVASALGKILWLLQVGSHEEFHTVTPLQYTLYGFALIVFLYILTNKLVWFYNHRIRSVEAKETGLAAIVDKVDAETFQRAYLNTMIFKKQVEQY